MKMFVILGWYCTTYGSKEVTLDLMFVDPCIIVQLLQRKTQQNATVYQNFIIPHFKWSSTCFGRQAAHHQETETAQAASGFAYVEVCGTCSCWTLSGSVYMLPDNIQQLHVRQPSTYAKPEAACAFSVSWWWAACRPKHVELHLKWGIIKFWYTVASCWVFLCKVTVHWSLRFDNWGCVIHFTVLLEV
jgi:hypothetical protein